MAVTQETRKPRNPGFDRNTRPSEGFVGSG
jgi:hypothetical protein